MTCATNHPPIEHQEPSCPLCRALWETGLLRALISDFGVTLLDMLERGAVVLQECDRPEATGTRH